MLIDLSIKEFADDLGSGKPAPGGGSASALAGALASSLVKMVGHLSGEGHEELLEASAELQQELLDLVTKDTEAFNQVMASFRLPRGTEEEKQARRAGIQKATKLATSTPLEIMEVSLKVLVLAKEMAIDGNKNAVSDAGVAGLLASAAAKGASYNVLINLPSLKDEVFVEKTKTRLNEILAEVESLEKFIADYVMGSLI